MQTINQNCNFLPSFGNHDLNIKHVTNKKLQLFLDHLSVTPNTTINNFHTTKWKKKIMLTAIRDTNSYNDV